MKNPRTRTVIILAALAVYAIFYPSHFLIADELDYFQQAMIWSGESNAGGAFPPCPEFFQAGSLPTYPAGTGLLAALAIHLGGPKSVFWVSILLWLLGSWTILLNLHRHQKPLIWALYPAFFLPGLVLTRTLMSDMPSFALAAVFIWMFCAYRQHRVVQFFAGFLAGLALLFRETNLLWSLPFLIGAYLRREQTQHWLALGFGLGCCLRAGIAWHIFGDPLFFKDPGIGFSWSAIPGNLFFYAAVMLVLAPAGLWLWWKTRHPYKVEMGFVIALFLLVYSAYDYEAFDKSGYKGLVLQARYMLPLLPIFALSAAYADLKFSKKMQIAALSTAAALFLCVQIGGWAYNREQQKITKALQDLPTGTHISFTPDESRKFLNPLLGQEQFVDGNTIAATDLACQNSWYAHTVTRFESTDRVKKAQTAERALQTFFKNWEKQPVIDLQILDGTRLQVWKAQRNTADE